LHEGRIGAGFVVPPLKGKEQELVVEAVLQELLILAISETHPSAIALNKQTMRIFSEFPQSL
jgi:hypothetical protein